jgi:hypothetical protein
MDVHMCQTEWHWEDHGRQSAEVVREAADLSHATQLWCTHPSMDTWYNNQHKYKWHGFSFSVKVFKMWSFFLGHHE